MKWTSFSESQKEAQLIQKEVNDLNVIIIRRKGKYTEKKKPLKKEWVSFKYLKKKPIQCSFFQKIEEENFLNSFTRTALL